MASSRKPPVALGELEAAVLEALWRRGELSTPDVHAEVGVPRKLAYTTVLTVLQRLTRKRFVVRQRSGRSHLYAPAMTPDEFAERQAEALAAAFVEVGAAGVGAFLAEVGRLDPEAVRQLRRRLETRR